MSRFPVCLVRFDTPFPFGEKADEYEKLAKELSSTNNLLISDVGVEEYGDKFNHELADKYGFKNKDEFPKLALFKQNSLEEPIVYTGEWKVDALKAFLREHGNIRLLLEGCLSQLDDLAAKFISSTEDREKLLEEASKVTDGLEGKDKSSGDIYLKLMQKVIERGDKFVLSELERVKNLLSGGKMNDSKRKDLQQRVNIIQSFRSNDSSGDSKTEL